MRGGPVEEGLHGWLAAWWGALPAEDFGSEVLVATVDVCTAPPSASGNRQGIKARTCGICVA
jgi:hypothetical protein